MIRPSHACAGRGAIRLAVCCVCSVAASGLVLAQEGSAQEELDCSGPAWERRGTECAEVAPPRNDGRRTFGQLPSNFGRGAVGVFSLDNLVPFAVGTAATGVAFGIDGDPRPPGEGSEFGDIGHSFGNPVGIAAITVGAFAAGRIADEQRFRDWTYDVLLATSVNYLYTEVLKRTVSRTRPDGSNDKSFPSGHTSNAFAWATVLNAHYGLAVGVPMYTVATLIGLSRIDRGSHYFSDVVAGAVIGLIVGRTIVRRNGAPRDGPQLAVVPVFGPRGGPGIGFTLTY